MGIVNRTPDSFYDQGATFALDALLTRPGRPWWPTGPTSSTSVGVKAGPGPEVTEAEELDRVIPAIEALHARIDVPLSVDTWRASVARPPTRAGAVVGNDISGFADPDYLPAAAEAGATVVATHIRLAPRVRDPEPVYDDVVEAVRSFLSTGPPGGGGRHRPDRIVLDAGLDLGKTAEQSLTLLRASAGWPPRPSPAAVRLQQDVPRGRPRSRHRPPGEASLAAAALGRGPRVPDRAGPRRGRHPPGVRQPGRRAGGGLTMATRAGSIGQGLRRRTRCLPGAGGRPFSRGPGRARAAGNVLVGRA
jgi:dihydropteroate synthase